MTVLSSIPIQSYRKGDLRVILMNPKINLKDAKAVAEAIPMHHKKFRDLLKKKLSGKVPEEQWKNAHVLSADIVELIVAPDPAPINNRYSRT